MKKDSVTSPRGDAFKRAGPAAPIKLRSAPDITAEAGGERLVIKHGPLFVVCRTNGDIQAGLPDGLYAGDTRFLSQLTLSIGGKKPVVLSSSDLLGYGMSVALTNPRISTETDRIPQQTLSVTRDRFLDERMYEKVTLTNHGGRAISTDLSLRLDADFADTFEVRRVLKRPERGEAMIPKLDSRGVTFAYIGVAEIFRESLVKFDPKPDSMSIEGTETVVTWAISLDPGERMTLGLTVEAGLAGQRRRARGYDTARKRVGESFERWRSSCTEVHTDNDTFNVILQAAIRDVNVLTTELEDKARIVAAGIPWFVAPFGRDSLLTSHELLMLNPQVARETLEVLAGKQSQIDDPDRDAEPGKILHEIRYGELAQAGLIPHTPYYGSVDSTPLFILVAGNYLRWSGDIEFINHIRPSLEAAINWMDDYGDIDGDGFIEYSKRSPAGLINQGWKDSEDSVVHQDGSLAEPPIALAEVQGYAYLARKRMADIYDALGFPDLGEIQSKKAGELKEAFNDAFWMKDEGYFALALDGSKNQVKSISSNPGQCLYCGIIDESLIPSVTERLMSPQMFSGWGIRTLSSDSVAYNPLSYHNGSIWPHDNAIIAAGLKRYGLYAETERIATALFSAATVSRDSRLPELYCGFDQVPGLPYVSYPVACSPQAWATAAPFLVLQSILGFSAQATEGVLSIHQPRLPDWLKEIHVSGMRVGDGTVGMSFTRREEGTSFALIEQTGSVGVHLEDRGGP